MSEHEKKNTKCKIFEVILKIFYLKTSAIKHTHLQIWDGTGKIANIVLNEQEVISSYYTWKIELK